MAKFFVSAVAMWKSVDFGGVRIAVSVESENGQPVTDLTQGVFTVGFIGSSGSGAWVEQKISGFEASGSMHGFYLLFIANYTLGSYVLSWHSLNADSVFTVEVETPPRVVVGEPQTEYGRGQTLAINTPTTPT